MTGEAWDAATGASGESGDDWLSTGFGWRDGERLLRFGPEARRETLSLLAAEGLAPFALFTTPRAASSMPDVVAAAAQVVHVPAGAVPEAGLAAEAGLLAGAGLLADAGSAATSRQSPVDGGLLREAGRPVASLLALGGGRVMDVCKAVAAAHGLPCAAVPTTLSGAELSAYHRPLADGRGAGSNRPRLVVTDPVLAASQLKPELIAGAMNAFGHAMEATYGPGAGPVTSAAAVSAARLLVQGLEDLRDESGEQRPGRERSEARARLALGALLAGYAIAAAGLGLHHVLCQTVVRSSGAPHAKVNAVLAPHVFRYMVRAAPSALAPIAAALRVGGGGEDPAGPMRRLDAADQDPAARLRRLAAGSGVTRLSELGVSAAELPDIARLAARRPELAATPSRPGEREALALLLAAV
jgi:alcohol dehydrogenase class IV